ncbi:MAG: hypothetical protein QW439_00640 [Candidatus Woesearchaeota archaeon]
MKSGQAIANGETCGGSSGGSCSVSPNSNGKCNVLGCINGKCNYKDPDQNGCCDNVNADYSCLNRYPNDSCNSGGCTPSCPAPSNVDCGTTYTGSNGCGGSCYVVGTKCDAGLTCNNGRCEACTSRLSLDNCGTCQCSYGCLCPQGCNKEGEIPNGDNCGGIKGCGPKKDQYCSQSLPCCSSYNESTTCYYNPSCSSNRCAYQSCTMMPDQTCTSSGCTGGCTSTQPLNDCTTNCSCGLGCTCPSICNVNGNVGYGQNCGGEKCVQKHTWDGVSGCCLEASQCLVDPGGNLSRNGNVSAYFSNDKPRCVNSGQFILDHYCDDGNWVTRTSLVAAALLNYTKTNSIQNYTIFCDEYEYSLNYYDYQPASQNLLRQCSNNGVGFPCFNSFCILRYKDSMAERVIAGTALNIPINDTMQLINRTSTFCNNVNSQEDRYFSCSDRSVWYNPKLQLMIFSNQNFEFSQSLVSSIIAFFKQILNSLFRSGQNDQLQFSNINSNRIYLASVNGRQVKGSVYDWAGDTFLIIKYSNFNTDICEQINKKYQGACVKDASCSYFINRQKTQSANFESLLESWPQLTAMLRIGEEASSLNKCNNCVRDSDELGVDCGGSCRACNAQLTISAPAQDSVHGINSPVQIAWDVRGEAADFVSNFAVYVSNCSDVSACDDGTFAGDCSVSKPKKCENLQLVNKCTECGCPDGKVCNSSTEECQDFIMQSASGEFSPQASVYLNNPSSGEVLPAGSVYHISGSYQVSGVDTSNLVWAILFYDGSSWSFLSSNIPIRADINAEVGYDWTVPQASCSNCLIRVGIYNLSNLMWAVVGGRQLYVNNTFSIVSGPTCTDSDNGLSYSTAGRVTITNSSGTFEFSDSCAANILTEYYCEGSSVKNETHNCDGQCIEGACVIINKLTGCSCSWCGDQCKVVNNGDSCPAIHPPAGASCGCNETGECVITYPSSTQHGSDLQGAAVLGIPISGRAVSSYTCTSTMIAYLSSGQKSYSWTPQSIGIYNITIIALVNGKQLVNSTVQVRVEDCISEGQQVVNNKQCCPGLSKINNSANLTNGGCSQATGEYCTAKCGNGVCDSLENRCNCPEDCSPTIEAAITLIKPASGEELTGGAPYTIEWTSANLPSDKPIRIIFYNGSAWEISNDNSPIAYSLSTSINKYQWNIPNINCNNCSVRVGVYDPDQFVPWLGNWLNFGNGPLYSNKTFKIRTAVVNKNCTDQGTSYHCYAAPTTTQDVQCPSIYGGCPESYTEANCNTPDNCYSLYHNYCSCTSYDSRCVRVPDMSTKAWTFRCVKNVTNNPIPTGCTNVSNEYFCSAGYYCYKCDGVVSACPTSNPGYNCALSPPSSTHCQDLSSTYSCSSGKCYYCTCPYICYSDDPSDPDNCYACTVKSEYACSNPNEDCYKCKRITGCTGTTNTEVTTTNTEVTTMVEDSTTKKLPTPTSVNPFGNSCKVKQPDGTTKYVC